MDYSNMPFNVLGQVCLPFSIIWFFLSYVAIRLDDWLRKNCLMKIKRGSLNMKRALHLIKAIVKRLIEKIKGVPAPMINEDLEGNE